MCATRSQDKAVRTGRRSRATDAVSFEQGDNGLGNNPLPDYFADFLFAVDPKPQVRLTPFR